MPREVTVDLSQEAWDEAVDADACDEDIVHYVQADSYLERIAKYVPAEVLAFSVFINAILDQELKMGGPHALMAGVPVATVAIAVLIAGTVLTPFYIWYIHQQSDAWVTNAFVSTLVFPFWSYALDSAAFAGYWDGNLAAILLATASVVSGLFSPRLPRAKRRKERERELIREHLRERDSRRERTREQVRSEAEARPHATPNQRERPQLATMAGKASPDPAAAAAAAKN